ncbi:hypothetical protein [Pinirhizobacter soli]|uniref:hypothetical protein n=1 Tax=Pinirhizobacter soli TaxID=2786953 RepID=UPI00202A0C1E|nr:hypothetical protein [Pinirhizobacter soli]
MAASLVPISLVVTEGTNFHAHYLGKDRFRLAERRLARLEATLPPFQRRLIASTLITTSVAAQVVDADVRMRSLVSEVVHAKTEEERSNAEVSLENFFCGLGPAGRRALSDRTVDAMAESLKEADEVSKETIAQDLGALGARARRALPQLKEALANDHPPPRRGFGNTSAAVPLYRAIDAIERDLPQSCEFGKP